MARLASAAGHEVIGTSSCDLDITDRAAVLALVRSVRPRIVVNTAYRADSWAVSADGAAHVALAATGARLVHISTDALHSGRNRPYSDDEPPTPVHMYGAAKAAAETAVAAIDPAALIVRTSTSGPVTRSRRRGAAHRAVPGPGPPIVAERDELVVHRGVSADVRSG